jgi:hypothetical protein
MINYTIKPACDNSPKKAFLRDFNIAFAEGNGSFIMDHVAENIELTVYGDFDVHGREAFKAEIDHMLTYPRPKELIIESIITHGKEAAVHGCMVMGESRYVFCDVCTFTGTGSFIIEKLKSFVVKI